LLLTNLTRASLSFGRRKRRLDTELLKRAFLGWLRDGRASTETGLFVAVHFARKWHFADLAQGPLFGRFRGQSRYQARFMSTCGSPANCTPRRTIPSQISPSTLLLSLLKLGVEPVNYLAPPIKRCLKFMAPAVEKIEFLLLGHLFPVCMVLPVLSISSPPLSHGENSHVCELPPEIVTFPAFVENALKSARGLKHSNVGPVC